MNEPHLAPATAPPWRTALSRWFDHGNTKPDEPFSSAPAKRVEWIRVIPFIGMHLACLGVFAVGWHTGAVVTGAVLYAVRMFAITGF